MSTLESQQRSSGRRPTVYETIHAYNHQHRDIRDNVSYTREQRVLHILATSQALAEAAWRADHGYPNSGNELLSCIPVLTVDLFIDVNRGSTL